MEHSTHKEENGTVPFSSRIAHFRKVYQNGSSSNHHNHNSDTQGRNNSSQATQNYNSGLASFGESNNTRHAYKAAIKCFDSYAAHFKDVPSLSNVTEEMIENDNLKVLLLKFAMYLGNTDIPSQRGGNLTVPSKMNYLSKVKESLMKKFPHHPAWVDATTDKTGWWSQLRCRAEKAMKRNDGSDVFQT